MKLSKALSSLLRHNFEKEGLKAQPGNAPLVCLFVCLFVYLFIYCYRFCLLGGYIFIDEMMALPKFKRYSLEQVKSAVDSSDKQRFSIKPHPVTGSLMIRANQGHSIKVIYLQIYFSRHVTRFLFSTKLLIGQSLVLSNYSVDQSNV